MLDVTYTASADNTDDSHFRVDPNEGAPGSPTDWTSPVDYSKGSIHVQFEVLTKPSDKVALLNICFEGTPNYACMPYSDPFTAVGSYEFEKPFSSFYQSSMVDWSIKLKKIPLIIKDQSEKKVQGDPAFYPTQMHVTLTLVAKDATFVPPTETPDAGMDSGTADAAMGSDAAMADAATSVDAGVMPTQMDPPKSDAGKPAQPAAAGGSGGSASLPESKPDDSVQPPSGNSGASADAPMILTADDNGGCSAGSTRPNAGSGVSSWWALAFAVLWIWLRRTARARGGRNTMER